MANAVRVAGVLFLAAFLACGPTATGAFAISTELAKKCRELAVKAHPPKRPGSRRGSAQAEREFYQNCIAKDGNVDHQSPAPADAPR